LADGASVVSSYESGSVAATTGYGFGSATQGGSFVDAYWDSDNNSGLTGSSGASATGLTTAQFQSGLPAGFASWIWGESSAINGGLPYLVALPPG
jgi:hypothetical protein